MLLQRAQSVTDKRSTIGNDNIFEQFAASNDIQALRMIIKRSKQIIVTIYYFEFIILRSEAQNAFSILRKFHSQYRSQKLFLAHDGRYYKKISNLFTGTLCVQ